MIIRSSLTRLSVALMACMGLAACGHHSNSNNHNDDEIRGDVQVLDGAQADARIFADLNRNHEWDSDEPRVTLGGDGKTYTDKEDIKKIADAHYNSEQTNYDANYKNAYNNTDRLENTHFGKQWYYFDSKGVVDYPLNYTGIRNLNSATPYGLSSAPEAVGKALCPDMEEKGIDNATCDLSNVKATGVHVGHVYDPQPLGANQLTSGAVGNRDAQAVVSFSVPGSNTVSFVSVGNGFDKTMLKCVRQDPGSGEDIMQYVTLRNTTRQLGYPFNFTSSASGFQLKDCAHTPDQEGGPGAASTKMQPPSRVLCLPV